MDHHIRRIYNVYHGSITVSRIHNRTMDSPQYQCHETTTATRVHFHHGNMYTSWYLSGAMGSSQNVHGTSAVPWGHHGMSMVHQRIWYHRSITRCLRSTVPWINHGHRLKIPRTCVQYFQNKILLHAKQP